MNRKLNMNKFVPDFLRVIIISSITGVACGLVGAVFVKSISFVTELRENNGWILYLLPILGLVLTFIYNIVKVKGVGTNHIIKSVRTEEKISPLLSVAVFSGTVLSHFGGASVGREGAALQLGGSLGELFARVFKIPEDFRRILVMSGMSGCFAALFGTPFAAFVFALEIARVGKRCFEAIVPAFVSSITAFVVANKLGVEPEHFPVNEIPDFSPSILLKFLSYASHISAIISPLFRAHLSVKESLLF